MEGQTNLVAVVLLLALGEGSLSRGQLPLGHAHLVFQVTDSSLQCFHGNLRLLVSRLELCCQLREFNLQKKEIDSLNISIYTYCTQNATLFTSYKSDHSCLSHFRVLFLLL